MMSGISALPEDCIAAVISFTNPRDACRLACVSTTFRSAADSDTVWDRFLLPEYLSAISYPVSDSSSSTWSALSKKELYLRACPSLIHNGKLSFWLDHPSGKKCYMISARELTITWAGRDTTDYWRWIDDFPGARCSTERTVSSNRDVNQKDQVADSSQMRLRVQFMSFTLQINVADVSQKILTSQTVISCQ
ncbi:hypothetical protein Ddye_022636 [Dipteronia dyeriana]|uniref:F-box domain-containing protein n=1 Tax=Dipteronia dyeriana TaxID=168575 RepID=A0AAD9TRZ5_9ROSI|nr:hypothetical protein Ddye_022636 [Dipteronia dyeriana]